MRRSFFLFIWIVLTSSAQAALTWEQPEQEFHPGIHDEQVTAKFVFTNTGDSPVTITSVKTGCACTTTALEKETYAPGESGELTATFAYDLRTGVNTRRVIVATDPKTTPTTKLYMEVHIPEVLKMSPWMLYWHPEEAREPKTVRIQVTGDDPVELKGAEILDPTIQSDRQTANADPTTMESNAEEARDSALTSDPNTQRLNIAASAVHTNLETVDPGREYLLTVTPNKQMPPGDVMIRLLTDRPEEHDKLFKGYRVRVRILPAEGQDYPVDQRP